MNVTHGHVETELKLAINIADIPLLKQQAILRQYCKQGPIVKSLLTTYYDTIDKVLCHHGFSLRIRRMDKQWIQTIKTCGRVDAGLHQREEWCCELSHAVPDFKTEMPAAMRKLLASQTLVARIKPLFCTEFERTTWLMSWSNSVEIELVLDVGKIYTKDAELPICEIECELCHGSIDELMDFAATLQQFVPLNSMNQSKAARGYTLLS